MTLETVSTTARLLSLTALSAGGTSIDAPLSGDDEAFDGGVHDGEEVATAESASTVAPGRRRKVGPPLKPTDASCLDERSPLLVTAAHGRLHLRLHPLSLGLVRVGDRRAPTEHVSRDAPAASRAAVRRTVE